MVELSVGWFIKALTLLPSMSGRNQVDISYDPLTDDIKDAVNRARNKHPKFCRNKLHLMCVLIEEVVEFLWAFFVTRKPRRMKEEALDIIAVLVRVLKGDMEK